MTTECNHSSGGCGCLSILVFIILGWALIFGVTYNGRHYGIECNTGGVEIK